MNLFLASPSWLIGLLVVLLIAAAAEDAIRLRISNLSCVLVLIGALVAMTLRGFSVDLWQNAVVCIAVLAIGTPAFAAGLFGGGDVKLLAAIGLWLDLDSALYLMVAVILAGGVLGLVYLAGRKVAYALTMSAKRNTKIPYGLAIVAGTLFVVGTQVAHHASDPVFQRLGVTAKQGP